MTVKVGRTIRGKSIADLTDESEFVEARRDELAIWAHPNLSSAEEDPAEVFMQTCPVCDELVYDFIPHPRLGLYHVLRSRLRICIVPVPGPSKWWVRLLKWIIQ
jgi:hypothetical protein